ncbi:receptor-type tyrosine-protein phosphatase kappa-like [Haliotis rubra]|uniref:receptor-type tyrosine-protein phosphatase kappa-like n=1 Tax=Haliotis rubra TaxID=36100 RepID=UPI001EE50BB5|nr:receptor-type tyrosine-protein phosphatase kappa-like [Haliotis rubra]
MCPEGKYGQDCAQTCGHCYQKSCDPEYGECQKNCEEGYSGHYCTDKCPDSRYGRNCEGECGQCKDGEPCNKKTGICFRGCSNGYIGYKCDEKCPWGMYGKNCKVNCGYCKTGTTCDPVTGRCLSGCQAGKMGDNCTTDCEDGMYGENCSFACGSCKFGKPCLAKTGQCMDGCSDGFLGYRCAEGIVALEEGKITGGIIAAVVIFLIIAIIIVVVFVVYRRRRHKRMDVSNPLPLDPRDTENNGHSESARLLSDSRVGDATRLDQDENGGGEEINEPIYVNINSKKQTSPVKLVDLADYIKKHRENNCLGFKQEFEELPMGLLALCEVARRADNKAKNRYGNIVAYDHSRVTLDPMANEANSDYVNANFMDGYSKQHQYIASQGPNKAMIRDFWRMVWQQRVCKVVMLTNLVEACKKKCEQYWPEEGGIKYGEVTVRIVDTAKYTDYTIRTFEISQLEISRIVKQFHFTTWSDHGAPTYPTTLLAFRRKVQMYNPESSAPILCHCSAGIGRTGTYIALDYLLEQAQSEDQVDVLCIAQLMRTNRVNMIQTWEQYAFVYDAVLEAVKSGETTIAKSAFRSTYQNMLSSATEGEPNKLEEQYQVLQTLSPTVERSECSAAYAEENMNKNRFKNILPANRCRPFLYTPVDNCTDYINAVFLPGCTQKDRFIVTQMPLPNTVADFWRMLYDYTSDTIIMLNEFDRNDKSCALYWPEEYGYTEEYGPLNVELLSSSEADPDVTIRIFKLSHLVKCQPGCSPGNFGWKCKFRCACRRGPCHKETGFCESGCQEGKYGVGCQLLNECLYDSQGVNYTGTLSVGDEGKTCISWSHPFIQREGYTLDRFPPGDSPENYCRNPKNNYGNYGVKPWCFFSTTLKKNFVTCGKLKTCSCPDGLFGVGCKSVCHCRTIDEVCDKLFGTCKSGCAAGWTGLNCQRMCPEGKYGQDCAQTCSHCYQKSC